MNTEFMLSAQRIHLNGESSNHRKKRGNVMQTYKEKVAILASVDSLDKIEANIAKTKGELRWYAAHESIHDIFLEKTTLRVRRVNINRIISSPTPLTAEWAKINKGKNVYLLSHPHQPFEIDLVDDSLVRLGFVFETEQDARMAHAAFVESMK
jgi:hypothetical protein